MGYGFVFLTGGVTMNSIFFSLETARKSLASQQRALDVTGHNIANVNTPGYSRQTAILATTPALPYPSNKVNFEAGQVGTGVTVEAITRMRLEYIDRQIWQESYTYGENEQRMATLQKIEILFNEPSDAGIRSVVDKYFESLQELSKQPENRDARDVVRQRGIALAQYMNHTFNQLVEIKDDLKYTLQEKVKNVNEIGVKIAQLNSEIKKITAAGDNPNDLYDQRDYLLDQLSKFVDITVSYDQCGRIMVSINGTTFVNGDSSLTMEVIDINPPATGKLSEIGLRWQETGMPVKVDGGEFRAILDLYNTETEDYLQRVNDLTLSIAAKINSIHENGQGLKNNANDLNEQPQSGIPFFTFRSGDPRLAAKSIQVSAEIMNGDSGLNAIAAAARQTDPTVYLPGDGSNALAMAKLKDSNTLIVFDLVESPPGSGIFRTVEQVSGSLQKGDATFDDFIRGTIAKLGVDCQEAKRMVENQNALIEQLIYSRDAVSGVSLDEEAMNMIKYQHAYNAASRVITVVDGMIDTLINRVGLVGR